MTTTTTTATPTITTEASVRTYGGTYFDVLNPRVDLIDLVDIAHSLSLINRFGGHTPQPYSVAEHSIVVSNRVWRTTKDRGLTLAGLLHDAAEAYVGDMNGVIKHSHIGARYRQVEERIERVIETAFDLLPGVLSAPAVKRADREAFEWECSFVRDSPVRVAPNPLDVERAFLRQFHEFID